MEREVPLTRLLNDWRTGDAALMEKIVPLVYDELHRVARNYMRKQSAGHTLQATALINEAFLRLGNVNDQINDRGHFIGIVSRLMRHVVVDHARGKNSQRRGGDVQKVSLADYDTPAAAPSMDVLALNAVMEKLAKKDPRKVQAAELVYFCGMTIPEAAKAMDTSRSTLTRELAMFKALLAQQLAEPPE